MEPLPLIVPSSKKATSRVRPPDTFEASRTEKLRRIEALGLDPWGGRFDDHQPIEDIRELPLDEANRPRVRVAGRIVLRRIGGKVHFLDVRDWSGQPTTRAIKGGARRARKSTPGPAASRS